MSKRHKVLLLDDDQDLLDIYKDLLARLPSKPEIHTTSSGARAIAILEAEPFTLLLSDLNMPKMDGLQVLTIVKGKFPTLRTAVMTSVVDEHFRKRAYEMGVDLYLEKPNSSQEIQFFLDCVESLLDKPDNAGFRGVQSKSLMDIIQLECLSQSSSTLKFTNGPVVGKIYIINGDIFDAEVQDLKAEDAIQKILSWRTGSFETLPAEPNRERKIFNSYQGLLLEASQALDEAQGHKPAAGSPEVPATAGGSPLAELIKVTGIEFVVTVPDSDKGKFDSLRLENPERIAHWARLTIKNFKALGEDLKAGDLIKVDGTGFQHHLAIVNHGGKYLCVGLNRSLSTDLVSEALKTVISKWAS